MEYTFFYWITPASKIFYFPLNPESVLPLRSSGLQSRKVEHPVLVGEYLDNTYNNADITLKVKWIGDEILVVSMDDNFDFDEHLDPDEIASEIISKY